MDPGHVRTFPGPMTRYSQNLNQDLATVLRGKPVKGKLALGDGADFEIMPDGSLKSTHVEIDPKVPKDDVLYYDLTRQETETLLKQQQARIQEIVTKDPEYIRAKETEKNAAPNTAPLGVDSIFLHAAWKPVHVNSDGTIRIMVQGDLMRPGSGTWSRGWPFSLFTKPAPGVFDPSKVSQYYRQTAKNDARAVKSAKKAANKKAKQNEAASEGTPSN